MSSSSFSFGLFCCGDEDDDDDDEARLAATTIVDNGDDAFPKVSKAAPKNRKGPPGEKRTFRMGVIHPHTKASIMAIKGGDEHT